MKVQISQHQTSNTRGFTLVELMVVLSITLLVLFWGVPSFGTWNKKHNIEGQMVNLYGDLQFARMTAYSRKVVSGVWWGGNGTSLSSYQIQFDSDNDGLIDTQVPATATMSTKYPITHPAGQTSVSFDGRGIIISANNPLTLSVPAASGAAVDCVSVTSTRIILGKMNGATCTPK